MIGWIICKAYRDMVTLNKFQQALHELGTPTMVLWSIIDIDDKHFDRRKAPFHRLPPINQPINETIAGDFGGHPIEKELIRGGKENPHGGHGGLRLKIMVGGLGWNATLSSTRVRTNLNHRFGIH